MGMIGNHLARATMFDVGEASTGNIQLGVSCRIDVGEYEGIEMPFYLHFNTDDNTRRSLQQLRTMGVVGTDMQIAEGLCKEPAVLEGFGHKRFQVTIAEEKDQAGVLAERIVWVGGGVPLGKRLGKEGRARIATAIGRVTGNGKLESQAPSSAREGVQRV